MDENSNNPNNQQAPGVDPLSRVKTYQDAIKEALQTQEMSSAGMLMAEQKKREDFQKESEARSISNPKNKLLIAIASVLILAAIGVVVYAIINANKRPEPTTSLLVPSKYFLPEKMIEVTSSQLSRNTLAKIQQASTDPVENGEVGQMIITKEVKADPNSVFELRVKAPYTTEDFLAMLTSRAPEILRKSLDSEYLLGFHRSSQNNVFVLFRTTNYENAFAGMLTWEGALAKDMESIFPKDIAKARTIKIEEIVPDTVISTSTTSTSTEETSSSTPEVIQKTIDNTRIWHDRVIKNTDTRTLLDENGNVVFFYAIIDKEYIFFGANEDTFAEVMRRVRTAKLIR